MANMMYEVKITAVGEVRDAEGNLISAEPIEMTKIVNEEELRALQEGNK